MHFTEQQQLAISARNENLLLSAAAGSGKTSVLVERVLGLVRDGIDIDRMLVVTFTRAAAADMRLKLTRELSRRAADGDVRSREQLLRLGSASISTLHVFCSELLRANFESADVDPAFRILDDAEDRRLFSQAMGAALEDAYAAGGEDLAALDYARGPGKVRALAEKLYGFATERPEPEKWLEFSCDPARAPQARWREEIVRAAWREIDSARACMRLALAVPGCPARYLPLFERELALLDRMREISDYTALRDALLEFRPASLPRGKKGEDDGNEAAKDEAKAFRGEARERIRKIRLLEMPLGQLAGDTLETYPALRALSGIVLRAWEEHRARKREQSGLSFSDLERCAYRALDDPEVRKSVREQYACVFVDEYQDVSEMQEMLIRRVARADNLFLVGDVKQSIYRFRLAEPGLFLERCARYQAGEGGRLLPLTMNFRSRAPILHLVNRVFERVMTGGDAEILYDAAARLNPGLSDAQEGVLPGLHLIDKSARAEEARDEAPGEAGDALTQGRLIASQIRAMMEENPRLRYRDFAVITRAKTANVALLTALTEAGIPAYAEGAGGYFETMEVDFALSLLRLVANRRSDVALIGALRSCLLGLSNEELARIRIAYPDEAFSDAAAHYAQTEKDSLAERLRGFFALLDGWRLRMGAMGLGEFLRLVLDESGFALYAGALPGGRQRCANLDRLVVHAAAFDRDHSGSLSRFLQHAEFLKASGSGEDAQLLGENDDVVRLMTIHKSKGLEFPVVFAPLLERRYRSGGQDAPLFADRELGIGVKYTDARLGTIRTTLPMEAIQARTRREDGAEEMRLLYVLMTRAQERLILIGTVSDADAALRRARVVGDLPNAAESHLQLLLGALFSTDDWAEYLTRTVHSPSEFSGPTASQTDRDMLEWAERALRGEIPCEDAALEKMLLWKYPDARAAGRPLKLTASGLLRQLEGPREVPELSERPQFLSRTGMTGAERGSAYHRALQMLDLTALRQASPADILGVVSGQLERLHLANRLSDAEFSAVRADRLSRFFSAKLGRRLLSSPTVLREWPFNVFLRVSEAVGEYADGMYSDDELLVQGTVDCCFEEDGEWVLLDYKTDRADDPEAIRVRYQSQMNIYALALERITGRRVKERNLCLLGSGEVLALQPAD